jgi:hypothetical protein
MTRPIICALLLGGQVFATNLQRSAQLSSPAEDAERIGRLTKTGVRLETDRVTAWFSAGAMSQEEMKALVDRLSIGVAKLEAFVHTPRGWQDSGRQPVEYYFDSGAFFIPHATVNRQVLIPISRLRDKKAPILHETTHALLTPPQGRRPLAWLTEGLAAYVAKAVSRETGIQEGDTFEVGEVDELDTKCAARLASSDGARILPFIGATGNLQTLYAMEPAFAVRQVFYGCSASFTKHLVERLGIEAVVDVLPEGDPHSKLEALSKMKMSDLRSEWLKKIGAPAQSR